MQSADYWRLDVTGGIAINLENWVKAEGADGDLEQKYAVDTGTVLTINEKSN